MNVKNNDTGASKVVVSDSKQPDAKTENYEREHGTSEISQEQPAEEGQGLILGKFKSYEELEASYSELQKKMGTVQEEPQAQEQPVEQVETQEFDIKNYENKYLEQGQLSPEDYAELAKNGYQKEVVDTYIEAVKVKHEKAEEELLNEFGGREAYEEAVVWATENWDEGLKNEFNKLITSESTARIAMKALFADMGQVQKEPKLVSGKANANNTATNLYTSVDTWKNDLKNPRYKSDQAFRDMVDQKYTQSRHRGLL